MSKYPDARQIPHWVTAITLLLGVLLLAPVCGNIYMFAIDFPRQKTVIKDRHIEARALIEFVYRYFDSHGAWPTEEVVTTAFPQAIQDGWTYYPDGNSWMPVLSLSGPYHMSVRYTFEPPVDRQLTRDWIFSLEGSKAGFQSAHAYHLPP
jgi:hypothetical protein